MTMMAMLLLLLLLLLLPIMMMMMLMMMLMMMMMMLMMMMMMMMLMAMMTMMLMAMMLMAMMLMTMMAVQVANQSPGRRPCCCHPVCRHASQVAVKAWSSPQPFLAMVPVLGSASARSRAARGGRPCRLCTRQHVWGACSAPKRLRLWCRPPAPSPVQASRESELKPQSWPLKQRAEPPARPHRCTGPPPTHLGMTEQGSTTQCLQIAPFGQLVMPKARPA